MSDQAFEEATPQTVPDQKDHENKPLPSPVAKPAAQDSANTDAEAPARPGEQLAFQAAARFGRVDEEGRVFVKDGDAEREVGQYASTLPADPLELYIRRFLDLQAQVDLAQARLSGLSAADIDFTLANLEKALQEPAAVGDLAALRARVEKLREDGVVRKAQIAKEREAAKARALEDRTKIVTLAEEIAATKPERMQWKQSGQRLRDLFEDWRNAQRKGPRLDRATEDALWKRFSAARTAFDRSRKAFFSALDAQQAQTRQAKEKLIARAAELSTSTDWQGTSAAYRDLLSQWKAAGRASRKDDEELWQRFRAAQEGFFQARDAANAQADAEQLENLSLKEKLAEEAEKLLPIKDVNAAKALLRPILEKWDAAGRVPRSEMSRIEGRIRAVEQAIASAENEQWTRSNPETKARAQGMVGQLLESLASLESELEQARAAGNDQKAKSLEENIAARKQWLEQAQKAAGDQ